MLELEIVPDVYIYTNLISAPCKDGKVVEAKRVFVEMGENGCDPSLVTYNVLIGGLCRGGLIDEAFVLKRSMSENGLFHELRRWGQLRFMRMDVISTTESSLMCEVFEEDFLGNWGEVG